LRGLCPKKFCSKIFVQKVFVQKVFVQKVFVRKVFVQKVLSESLFLPNWSFVKLVPDRVDAAEEVSGPDAE
jgi:hypothetical protein